MSLIENKDYRIVGKIAYVRQSLKRESFDKDSEVFYAVHELWSKGYEIKFIPDYFILTPNPNSTVYDQPPLL